MRILVTGGAGFIGSHLVEKLINQGNEVWVVDNLSSGHIRNIHDHVREFHQCDVSSFFYHRLKPNFDRIYNLACPASPIFYQKSPLQTFKSSVRGMQHVLDFAMQHRVPPRVLQASTSEVYGDPLEHPQQEEYFGNVNMWGPRSCYDEGKRAAETLLYLHRDLLPIRCARIFNTYGPRMQPDDGRVVSNFIVQALSEKPLTIYGDGYQTRSLCYVSDTVEGLITLMESDVTTPVNIGGETEISILQLAKTILSELMRPTLMSKSSKMPQDDPKVRKPDLTRLKALGWTQKVGLIQGLSNTIEYFKHGQKAI